MLRFVLIADTHSAPHAECARWVERERPDWILHAGDIGDLRVLDRFAAIAPVAAVRGNIDGHSPDLPDGLTLEVQEKGETWLTLLLVHIGVVGPRLRADAARRAHSENASVVVCGHSHVPFVGRDAGLTIVNPGSVGPRRFHLPIVFGVMDVGREKATVRHVSCETGERWAP